MRDVISMINLTILKTCKPEKCVKACPQRNLKLEKGTDEYDQILKKFPLIHHVEKQECPEDKFYTIEAWSHLYCPPERMYDYEDEINDQFEKFFKEIGIEIDEYSWGIEGLSVSAIIEYNKKLS